MSKSSLNVLLNDNPLKRCDVKNSVDSSSFCFWLSAAELEQTQTTPVADEVFEDGPEGVGSPEPDCSDNNAQDVYPSLRDPRSRFVTVHGRRRRAVYDNNGNTENNPLKSLFQDAGRDGSVTAKNCQQLEQLAENHCTRMSCSDDSRNGMESHSVSLQLNHKSCVGAEVQDAGMSPESDHNLLQQQLLEDVQLASQATIEIERKLAALNISNRKLRQQIKTAEIAILESGERIKRYVDMEVENLLCQLEEQSVQLENELSRQCTDVEQILTSLLNFKTNAQEALVTWADDVTSRDEIDRLHSGFGELCKVALESTTHEELSACGDVTFRPSTVDPVTWSVGELMVVTSPNADDESRSDINNLLLLPTRVSTKTLIQAAAQLDDTIYVVCWRSNCIHTYDQRGNKLPVDLPVTGLGNPVDMVACADTSRLYVADSKSVFGVDVTGTGSQVTTGRCRLLSRRFTRPPALSVTSRRLLVTSSDQLSVFNADGQELEQIQLPVEMKALHAVELVDSRTFIVVHLSTSGINKYQTCISELNGEGHVIRVCGETNFAPHHVISVATGDGFLLAAADRRGGRVLLLNSKLEIDRVLLPSGTAGLCLPSKLCYVPDVGRLLVVEWNRCCFYIYGVRIMDGVNNQS